MAWVPAAIAIGSAVVGAKQAQDAAEQEKEQLGTQQSIANFNAQLKEKEAVQKEQVSRFTYARRQEQARQVLSSQVAAFGKAGVRRTGTPLLTQIDTAENLAQDALIERFNDRISAQESRSEAEIHRVQAGSFASAGRSRLKAGKLQAGQQLFTAGSQIAQLG